MIKKILFLFLALPAFVLATDGASDGAAEKKLVIVASFPDDMNAVFEQAFEEFKPGVDVEIIKKKTTAGVKYLDEIKDNNHVDLFWVSAPDAFEVLKKKKLLQKYEPKAEGIPRRLSGYPVNDPDGYYSGFAAGGYGIMWNNEYLEKHKLPRPKQWVDLTRPEYFGHIGLSAPSRSGTTHLTIEAILQLKGWEPGWALIKGIAANAKIITAKSTHVPRDVVAGEFGIGIVIDFFGLAEKAKGAPVEFVYPKATVLVPANVGILKNAPEPELAKEFIEFLISPEGQKLLLVPQISRLPIRPEIYNDDLPDFYPRPYSAKELGAHVAFDVLLSKRRYNVVNSLFDVMITYRKDDLAAVMMSLHEAEKKLLSSKKANTNLGSAIARAKDQINQLPINELSASDPRFAEKFKKKRKKAEDVIDGEQGQIEKSWDDQVTENYRQARQIVTAVLSDQDPIELPLNKLY